MAKGYVDSDGHVMENERELNEFIEPPFNERYLTYRQLLPSLDGFHTPNGLPREPGTFDPTVGPEKWLEFLDKTETDYSECVKKLTHPSTKLRANGNYIDNIDNFPFVLRLSKHERIFSHTLSAISDSGAILGACNFP